MLLVSPPATHRPLAEAALAAGSARARREAVGAGDRGRAAPSTGRAAAAKHHVMVVQNYRFRRQPRALQTLVRDGRPRSPARHSHRLPARPPHGLDHPRDWRGRMTHPYLLDMAVHHVDLIRAITGREIDEVDARGWTVPDSPFSTSRQSTRSSTLDDGTPVAYEGNWADADRGDVVERRLGADRGEGACDVDGGVAMRCAARCTSSDTAQALGCGWRCRGSPWSTASPACTSCAAPSPPGAPPRRSVGDNLTDAWPPSSRSRGRSTSGARPTEEIGREDRPLPRALPRPSRSTTRSTPPRAAGCTRSRSLDGRAHTAPAALLADREARRGRVGAGLEISALSCHANPLHPDEAVARGGRPRLPRHRPLWPTSWASPR